MKPLKTTIKSTVNDLLKADPNIIGNTALKQAVEKFQAEEAAKDANRALNLFREAKDRINQKVARIREIRKQEKRLLTELETLNTALNNFTSNGDSEALTNTMRTVSLYT